MKCTMLPHTIIGGTISLLDGVSIVVRIGEGLLNLGILTPESLTVLQKAHWIVAHPTASPQKA